MMAHKKEASRLKVGTDLREQAVYHVEFLKSVDGVSALKKPHNLKRALYRYEKFWLPLAAEHSKECLTAPLDIEWIWHCHMLCPKAYETDCQAIVGLTVNHKLHSAGKFRDMQIESQKRWSRKYGNEEPFNVDFQAPYDADRTENFQSKITYDVVSAAQRQQLFYYQVSLPHHTDEKYLKSSLLRYKQFLYLKTQLPREFFVPCYDIDLMWHTHQLNPHIYKNDMMKIIGHLFNHDDTVNDRSEGSKLYNADKQTRVCWKSFYNEPFFLFGAMYRGDPPQRVLYKITPEDCYSFCTKICKISMNRLILTLPSSNPDMYKKVKLIGTTAAGNRFIQHLFKVSRPSEAQGATTITWNNIGKYDFNTFFANNINFRLQKQIGWGFCRSSTDLGSNSVNMLPEVESIANAGTGGEVKAHVRFGSNIQLDVECSFTPPTKGKTMLFLDRGTYENAVIPENIKQLFGPVSTERLPPCTNNRCQVASHRLENHLEHSVFTAKTIHSQALMMSVIGVYYHDKMAVIGHLVASDQLPLPTQVYSDAITINPKLGERAVLLKNNEGDWGILIGRWGGFRRGVAGTPQKRGVRGSPGTLYLRFYKMSAGKTVSLQLGYLSRNYVFNLESASIDLMKGIINVDSNSNEVAENIALAFSVSLLHVLCVPRPKGWKEGMQVKPTVTRRGTQAVTTIPSDDMAFIVAAGLLWSTPSNYYMHSYYGGAHICAMCGGGGGGVSEYDGNWGELAGGDGSGGEAGCDGSACGGGNGGGDGGGCGGCGGCGACL